MGAGRQFGRIVRQDESVHRTLRRGSGKGIFWSQSDENRPSEGENGYEGGENAYDCRPHNGRSASLGCLCHRLFRSVVLDDGNADLLNDIAHVSASIP